MLTKKAPCEICGADAVLEIDVDGLDLTTPRFALTRRCSAGCAEIHSLLTADVAGEMTGHQWDGPTGKWTRLASTSVEGWVP